MTEKTYGTVMFPDKIDITDPGYDEDVWCRVNNFPISAGEYECYAVIASNEDTHNWGTRVMKCGIRKVGEKGAFFSEVARIGVDGGLAGFFNCDNMKVFEDILNDDIKKVYKGDNYFVTSTGFGDGSYPVYAGYSGDKVVEVYIEFIEKE